MSFSVNNLNEFQDVLEEVDALIELSRIYENNDERKFSACKKSAILLLSSKFETFVETLVENYISQINSLSIPLQRLPESILYQHTLHYIGNIESNSKHPHKENEVKQVFRKIARIWGTHDEVVSLNIEAKFNYGRHGEKELNKLFKKIGFDNIFSEVTILEEQESLLEDDLQEVDIKNIFNSVNNLRNNILHQDASPSIGLDSVEKYRKNLEDFAKELSIFLENKINDLCVLES
jgi:hypothetical protein